MLLQRQNTGQSALSETDFIVHQVNSESLDFVDTFTISSGSAGVVSIEYDCNTYPCDGNYKLRLGTSSNSQDITVIC